MTTLSVVICAYTEERWDDLVAALASVANQRRPALETIIVILVLLFVFKDQLGFGDKKTDINIPDKIEVNVN